jgi:hypothetical protein
MRFLLLKHGQRLNLSYCILINFNHKHVKYITTIDKGKKIVEILEKSNKYHNKGYQKKVLTLQFHPYRTYEIIEELICNKIAKLIYMG